MSHVMIKSGHVAHGMLCCSGVQFFCQRKFNRCCLDIMIDFTWYNIAFSQNTYSVA
jgi:hypothetical protein